MAKLTLKNVLSGLFSTTALNTNFDDIETEFQDNVLYRDNPAGEPNAMQNDIDMNGNDLLNVTNISFGGVAKLTAVGRVAEAGTAIGTNIGGTVVRTSEGLYRLTLTTAATNANNFVVQVSMDRPTDDLIKDIVYEVISTTEVDIRTKDAASVVQDQEFSYIVYDRS